jgi:TPR repeat protein
MVGCGMPPDYEKARYWRAQLAKINRGRALYFEWLARSQTAPLARQNGYDSLIDADKIPHHALLLDAANAGDIQAHIELGIESAANQQLGDALKHFVYVERNSNLPSNNAGYIKELIAKSKQQSELKQSNLDKDDLAEFYWNQARRYHQGDGAPINYAEAIRLYKKAADLGNQKAKKMLNLIFSQSFDGTGINISWMQKLSRMNVSGLTPQLPTVDGPVLLLREETGLTDFIPRLWNAPGRAPTTELQPCQPEIAPC